MGNVRRPKSRRLLPVNFRLRLRLLEDDAGSAFLKLEMSSISFNVFESSIVSTSSRWWAESSGTVG